MNCIAFSIFYENEKGMRVFKIQSKNLFKHESNSQLFEFHFSYCGKNKI